MLYILALILPPLACLGAGKFWHAVLNTCLCLTVIGYPVAMLHAWFVVQGSYQRECRGSVVLIQNTNRG